MIIKSERRYIKMRKTMAWLIITMLAFSAIMLAETEKKEIPDFSAVERSQVPVEYTWNINDIYKSDAEWKADKEKAVKMMGEISAMSKDWTSSAKKMLEFYKFMDKIGMIGEKLYGYASHQSNADLGNPKYRKMVAELRTLFVQMGQMTAFVRPDILKLGGEKFAEYLKEEPGLEPYKIGVERLLRVKDHVLSQDKEEILALTGLFSGQTQQASVMLNNVEIPKATVKLSDGKEYTLTYQTYARLRESKKQEDREANMLAFWNNHKKFEKTLALLLDSAIKNHFFSAKVRGYDTCLQSRLFPQNIDEKVYRNLIATVKNNLEPLHEYLKLKQELLGLETFKYADMYASSVQKIDKKFTADEGQEIIYKSMKGALGEKYGKILKKAFNERWMDLYPNKDKQSGAYSGGVYGVHPFIKLNYVGSYDSVSTMAHELGHSLHSYFSDETQPYAIADYPIFLAEIASTFNENILMDYLLKTEDDDMFKLYILDNYVMNLRSTIYRQTLFAEFELAMHEHVEKGGTLDADWLNKKYLELTREYYGHDKGVCVVDEYIQNEWSSIPHFYYFYYVYQYSTGIISSMALADAVIKDGDTAAERYIKFLSAGGSKYPLDTLKDAGVDLLDQKSMERAMIRTSDLVNEMKKVMARLKKAGKL